MSALAIVIMAVVVLALVLGLNGLACWIIQHDRPRYSVKNDRFRKEYRERMNETKDKRAA